MKVSACYIARIRMTFKTTSTLGDGKVNIFTTLQEPILNISSIFDFCQKETWNTFAYKKVVPR